MSDRSSIKWFFGAAITALAIGMLIVPAAQAKDVPLYIDYTGTGHDLVPPVLGDPLPDNIVLADAKGSFGAKSTVIVAKFFYADAPLDNPCAEGFTYLGIAYGRAVTSFNDGSQLFATVIFGDNSYMCLDETNGAFEGSAFGAFIGGVGRFENASGFYTSPFSGQNLTSAAWGEFPFRSIKGSFEGVVTTP
jgi:hypothetical protein